MAGLGGTSGVRLRTPAGIGRGLEGWFPHAMAGHGTQWQARRAPPEAVPVCKRRDPPLPLTGNNRKRSGCPAIRKRNRPAITRMHRVASQWMRRSGVAPELVVPGAGNECGSTVTVFLLRLRPERDMQGLCIRLCKRGFPRTHALEVCRQAQASKRSSRDDGNTDGDAVVLCQGSPLVQTGHGISPPAGCDLEGIPPMDHGSFPMPVCASRTPPARPCVWSSVPCWSTGDAAYPHRHHSAWKRNRPAITGTAGREVSGCADQASRQNSSCTVFGMNGQVPSRSIC